MSNIIQRVKPSYIQSDPIEDMWLFPFLSKAWNKVVFGIGMPVMVSGYENQESEREADSWI